MADSKFQRDGDGNFHHDDYGQLKKDYDGNLRHGSSGRVVGKYDALTKTVDTSDPDWDAAVNRSVSTSVQGIGDILSTTGLAYVIIAFVILGIAGFGSFALVTYILENNVSGLERTVNWTISGVVASVVGLATLLFLLNRFARSGLVNSGAMFVAILVGLPAFQVVGALLRIVGLGDLPMWVDVSAAVVVGGVVGLMWRASAIAGQR